MKVQKTFKKRILYIDEALRVEYSKGKLYFVKRNKVYPAIRINTTFPADTLAHFSFTERLLRLEPRCLIRVTGNDFLLSHQGGLYKITLETGGIERIFTYSSGTKNPLYFCQYERNGAKEIVFGDYGGHDRMGNVGIFRFMDNTVHKIAVIDGTVIDHIHRVEYDHFRDCYWIFTGDTDAGSGIWRLSYSSSKAELFLSGKQAYRACVAYVHKDSILYATDSPIEKNCVYILDIESKRLRKLADLPGSCIYGIKTDWNREFYCFATAVEPDSALPKWRYRTTYRLGAGIEGRYCHVMIGNPDIGFHDIWKAKKDMLPMLLFQFGNVRFPIQDVTGKIYFCPQGCCGWKGTYVITLNHDQ